MSTPNDSIVANDSGSQAKVLCPYPDCRGYVIPSGKFCITCRRAITQCPNGHMMAAEAGSCDTCGYNAKSDRPASTTSGKFLLSADALLELIADTYREAALASLNMRSATELLESLRTTLAEESDYHKAWDKLDAQVGRTLDKGLRGVVVSVRKRFMRGVIEGEVSRVGALLASDQVSGWNEWLPTYAEALLNGRMLLAKALCNGSLAFSAGNQPIVDKLRRFTDLITEERWPETFVMCHYLSQQDAIPTSPRARLLVLAGEIELYQLKRPEPAKKLFDEAEQLAPEESRVLVGQGEYCLQVVKQFEKVLEYAQRVIALVPQSSQGYMLLGDCYEQQHEVDRAEEAYQDAIRVAPGETSAYSRLLRLYGSPERLATYESRLLPLQEVSSVIEPLNEYSLLLDLGNAYQQNGRYDEAHSWYDRAVKLNDRRLGAYIVKGYAYLEQEKPADASAMFAKAIEVAPEASDGYWGMYYLHDQGQEWQAATDAYEQSLMRLPELIGITPGPWENGPPATATFEEFKNHLFEMLGAEPTNQSLLNSLTALAELYKKSARLPDAVSLYDRIGEVTGGDPEGNYRNLAANARYFWKDYAGAIEVYKEAIKAKPTELVYHTNLSHAYQALKRWEEARQALGALKAADQDSQNSYAQQMAELWNAEGNDHFGQLRYQQAIASYQQAIEFDNKKPVYYGNLASAWESLKPETGKLEALINAIKALESATSLDSQDSTYAKRLKSLKQQLSMAETYGDEIVGRVPLVTPLAVEMASDLVPFVADANGELSEELKTLTEDLRARILQSMGIKVSGIRFRGNEGDLPPGSYIIMLMEIPIVMGTITINKRLFTGSEAQLVELNIKGEPTSDPLTGNAAYWVESKQCAAIKAAGLSTWSLLEYPLRHLEAIIRQNLNEFVDHEEVTNWRGKGTETDWISGSPEKLTAFTILLKALVSEQTPILSLLRIRGKFRDSFAEGKDLADIVEDVRSLPEVRAALAGNSSDYSFYRLGKRFTAELAESIRHENGHRFLALLPEKCRDALSAVREKISSQRNAALVVDQSELRPLVHRLTELEWPHAPVLSFSELLPELISKIVGEIELA